MTLSQTEKKRKAFLVEIAELRIREAEIWHERQKSKTLTGVVSIIRKNK